MSTHIEEIELVLERMAETSEIECIEECLLELEVLKEQYLLYCLNNPNKGDADE